MKLPRDVSGAALIKALEALNDEVTRQTGSHLRATTQRNGEHHVTVPNHDPLRVGTLNAILRDVAEHHDMTRTNCCNSCLDDPRCLTPAPRSPPRRRPA